MINYSNLVFAALKAKVIIKFLWSSKPVQNKISYTSSLSWWNVFRSLQIVKKWKIFPVCRNLKQAEKKMPSRTTTEASLHGKVGPYLRKIIHIQYWGRILGRNLIRFVRVFFLAVNSYLYRFALRFIFLQTHAASYSFYSSVTEHC